MLLEAYSGQFGIGNHQHHLNAENSSTNGGCSFNHHNNELSVRMERVMKLTKDFNNM